MKQNLLEMIDTGKLASKQLEDFRNQIQEKKTQNLLKACIPVEVCQEG